MTLKALHLIRRFSTSRILSRPSLSADYKSQDLWNERFHCKMLGGDEKLIKTINNKIIMNEELNNLEVDVFINIASPSEDELAQLQESIIMIRKHRRSLNANHVLSSTHHALCRLFLYSGRLPSLISVIENRVDYGVFPDFFALNLLLDEAMNDEKSNVLAAKLASWIMLQEEFGINEITDVFSLYSIAKYIESKPDFSDWTQNTEAQDDILKPPEEFDMFVDQMKETKSEDADDDDDDAEYIRIPFLRNPYNDNHFDLRNPRLICGKTLSMLGSTFETKDTSVSNISSLLGCVLQGQWDQTLERLDNYKAKAGDMMPPKDLIEFFVDNLNEVEAPSDEIKSTIITKLEELSTGGRCLSDLVEAKFSHLSECEKVDIETLRKSFIDCSALRQKYEQAQIDREMKKKLIEEVRMKKEELKRKEQYLYFYDNLKKSSVRRIDYS